MIEERGIGVATFRGQLWLAADPQSKVLADVDIQTDRIVITSGGATIGDWLRSEVKVNAGGDGVHFNAEGEDLVFKSETAGLVGALGGLAGLPTDLASRMRDAARRSHGRSALPSGNGAAAVPRQAEFELTARLKLGSTSLAPKGPAPARWLALMALAGFLLPFVSVSCLGRPMTAPEGWRLAAGVEAPIDPEVQTLFNDLDAIFADVDPTARSELEAAPASGDIDRWVLGAALLLVAALLLSFSRIHPRVVAAGFGMAAVSLLGFWLSLRDPAAAARPLGLDIQAGPGLWLSGISSVGAAGLTLLQKRSMSLGAKPVYLGLVGGVVLLIGTGATLWAISENRGETARPSAPMSCLEWTASYNSLANRFDAEYEEFATYVDSLATRDGGGAEAAEPIYSSAARLTGIVSEMKNRPPPLPVLKQGWHLALDGLSTLVSGVRRVGDGVAFTDAAVVDHGTLLISQGQATVTEGTRFITCP